MPWNDEFDWSAVNYSPIMVGAVFIAVGLWWMVSAKRTYTGPIRTIEFAGEGMGIAEEKPIEPSEPPPATTSR